MRRDDVLNRLAANIGQLRAMGVTSLALFGSTARDEARPDSDIDLLVDFEPPMTFDKYMDAKFFLEGVLGQEVDLVTRDALKERLRATIEREALHVA